MITTKNYAEKIEEIGIENLNPTLRDYHKDLKDATNNFTDWSDYHEDADIREATDLFFKELEKLAKEAKKEIKKSTRKEKASPKKTKAEKKEPDKYHTGQKVRLVANGEEGTITNVFAIKSGRFIPGEGAEKPKTEYSLTVKTKDSIKTVNEDEIRIISDSKKESKAKSYNEVDAKQVENVAEDVKFIKSFVGLHNKKKNYWSLRNLLARLQKAILQKLISKDSPFAKEIRIIQDRLVKIVNTTEETGGAEIIIEKSLLDRLLPIAGGEKVYGSIGYIKRYIGMQGKKIEKEKALSFASQVEKAIEKGKVDKADPYLGKLKSIIRSMNSYIAGKEEVVSISKAELNGLMGILGGCGCKTSGLGEIEESSSGKVMNSMDFIKMRFSGLGFKGKWHELIGDPAKGFTAMVFGKPKFGKSYLCVEFAGYLTRNHGKTLYVAKEEELDATLQIKVKEKNVAHPNLDVTDHLPDDLSPYQFVFLDSVTKLGLSPEALTRLEKDYPEISFIYIFQVTKAGVFKGRNEFQHDVDVVIEVPEKGLAIQNGRFNQGGEMQIFEEDQKEAA